MKTISILGAGRVGSAIIRDLSRDQKYQIIAYDQDPAALEKVKDLDHVEWILADLSDLEPLSSDLNDCDLVISAVPGGIGFQVLKQILQIGKNVVDISFFPEDPFDLDPLARENNLTAVVDCGVAPGLCNMIAGHVVEKWDETLTYTCYVGGLPVERTVPYQYKAVFSPADVLEEYTRPARLMRGGEIVTLPALSELEHIHFPGLGSLEAFNTDGLRTLLKTLPIRDMTEKTLRYPGHARLMEIFRDSGFFSPELIQIDGQSISPLSLTSRLLFKEWHLEPGEKDLTVMKVILTGTKNQEKTAVQFDLIDHYDPVQGVTSMSRTTGYTCAIIARQMLEGMIPEIGICPPEIIGRHAGCYQDLLENLAERGIHLQQSIPE